MSSSFALWLVGILIVVTGLVIWRVLTGGRTAEPAAPTVEGDPATVTGEQERPAAATEEPAPAQEDSRPAAPVTEPAGSVPAVAEQPAAENEPVAVNAEPVIAAAEPVAAEIEPVAAEIEPVAADVAPTPDETATPVAIPAPRTSVENTTAAAAEPVATPVAVPADRADDFRQIQGIGPKMATALQAAGIRTYEQLAELDEAALRETLKAAGVRAAPSVATWPQQAKLLAGARAEAEAVLP